jgi:hypothetical protein
MRYRSNYFRIDGDRKTRCDDSAFFTLKKIIQLNDNEGYSNRIAFIVKIK